MDRGTPPASVTRAQGQWLKDVEESRMQREKVRQEKLQTRRKELEHWVWERDFINEYFERDRKRAREREIEKSRTGRYLRHRTPAFSSGSRRPPSLLPQESIKRRTSTPRRAASIIASANWRPASSGWKM